MSAVLLADTFAEDLFEGIGLVAAFGAVGLAQLALAWLVDDAVTPGHLRSQIVEDGSWNAALYAIASLLSIGLIVFVAVLGTDASLRGLALATAWAATANVLQALGVLALRTVFRLDIRRVLQERAVTPEGALLAAANLALGLILAAAAS